MPEKFDNATDSGHLNLNLRLRKTRQENHVTIVTSSFSECSVFKTFSVHTKTQSRHFSNFSLKGAFEKFRFRHELVWTVGLTVGIKLRFKFLQCKVNVA